MDKPAGTPSNGTAGKDVAEVRTVRGLLAAMGRQRDGWFLDSPEATLGAVPNENDLEDTKRVIELMERGRPESAKKQKTA